MQQIQLLIEDADAAERSGVFLEGIQKALKSKFGISFIDVTTDDDEDGTIRIELIQTEDGPGIYRTEIAAEDTQSDRLVVDQNERLDSIGE